MTSEAAALRVLLLAGQHALGADALEAGYVELAKTYSGASESDERRSARVRYTERTDSSLGA